MDFLVISLILLGLALLGAIILVFVKIKKGEVKEINYKAFFVMGISYLGAGTALTVTINPGFLGITALGVIYMLIGLKNRDKWTNPEKET